MKYKSNKKGFTLIESVIVIVIIAIAAGGVLAVFINALKGAPTPIETTQGIEVAQEGLERVISVKSASGYATVVNGAQLPASPGESIILGGQTFTRWYVITEVSSADLTTPLAGSGYKRVEVNVRPPQTGIVTVTTLVTDY